MITSVLEVGGESTTSKMACAQTIHSINFEFKKLKKEVHIFFSNKDLRCIKMLHNDIVVILTVIANFDIQKIIIYSRNIVNVLLYDAFERIRLLNERLMPV